MKLLPWLLAGSLFIVARAIASAIPPDQDLPQLVEGLKSIGSDWSSGDSASQPDIVAGNSNPSTGLKGNDCKVAGPAVVTIHAGRAFGSGSIVKPEGLVITNNHVVQPARGGQIDIKLISGKQYTGQVVATDPVNDLALIKLNTQDRLPTVSIGSPSSLQTGQSVCAIGSPFARPGVLTRGTLTTVRRNGDLQSSLVLQPGNSGGPLLNQQGEMIGVNKAIWQSRSGTNSGISFATNIAVAKNFIEQGASGGNSYSARSNAQPGSPFGAPNGDPYMVPSYPMDGFPPDGPPGYSRRPPMSPFDSHPVPSEPYPYGMSAPDDSPGAPSGGRLGIMIDKSTLLIQDVETGSSAASAGIKTGDRLIAVDGIKLQGFDQLQEFLSQRPNSVVITVNRDEQLKNVRVNF